MKITINLSVFLILNLFHLINSECDSLGGNCSSLLEKLDGLSFLDECENIINEFSKSYHTPFTKDIIIAHRGLSSVYPEHSKIGFESAYFMGAHYLETDVNLTKDKKLIIFHDPYLDNVTDIENHKEFLQRRRNGKIRGYNYENKFFVSDFTYEELLTLFIKQRNPLRPQIYNQKYKILLLEDLIKMVFKLNKAHNKTTGIFIEPKFPDHYSKSLSVNINKILIGVLKKFGLNNKNSKNYKSCPIILQSFDYESLFYLKNNANLPQIALMRWKDLYNLKELKSISDGVGPDVNFILFERIDDFFYVNGTNYETKENFIEKVTRKYLKESIESLGTRIFNADHNKFLCYASSLGLYVYPWNLHNEKPKFHKDPIVEMAQLSNMGVSGFFHDFCKTALNAIIYSKTRKKN